MISTLFLFTKIAYFAYYLSSICICICIFLNCKSPCLNSAIFCQPSCYKNLFKKTDHTKVELIYAGEKMRAPRSSTKATLTSLKPPSIALTTSQATTITPATLHLRVKSCLSSRTTLSSTTNQWL